MKKVIIYLIAALLIFSQSPTFARHLDGEVSRQLPKAGLTPESPFYFLDKFGEAFREFFTFNPEAKARLQITFASERIAEIKIILETKGVEAKGIDIAQARLQSNIAKATVIVKRQKSKGRDISNLVKELDDGFESSKSALKQAFEEREEALEAQENDLESQLRVARRAGDTAKVAELVQQLSKVEAQEELLEQEKEEQLEALEEEEERLEEEMDARAGAEEKIADAQEEKEYAIAEAEKEGVELPADAFSKFDALLAQAQAAFDAGDFVEAKRLAKQAKKSIDVVEDMIDELEDILDAKEDAEEATKEAEEENGEDKEDKEGES